MDFKDIVEQRYATKKFDGSTLPEEKIDQLLEMIRLSASSFGLQPWKIKVISDQAMKDTLLEHSYNQPQINTASHLLVFCADTNVSAKIDRYAELMKSAGAPEDAVKGYTDVMRGFVSNMNDTDKKSWAQRQTYLAVGNALNGAKALGFDSCPMEGFNPVKYAEVLGLPENLVPSTVVAVGVAADQAQPKIRYTKEEMFF